MELRPGRDVPQDYAVAAAAFCSGGKKSGGKKYCVERDRTGGDRVCGPIEL
jgi:hypothetical protein